MGATVILEMLTGSLGFWSLLGMLLGIGIVCMPGQYSVPITFLAVIGYVILIVAL